MAETYNLSATKRENSKHSARNTRAANRIPGVIYGHGLENQMVSVDYSEFLRLFRRSGQASLIDMDVEGKKIKVLVGQYDLDPVKDTLVHIDFFAVNLKEKTTVHVPLIFEGESGAVKTHGGLLEKSHETIDIRCLPTEIPHDIKVDISLMKELGDHITIADLKLSETFEVMHLDVETVLAMVSAPKIIEEEETGAPEDTVEKTDEEKAAAAE